MRTCVQNFWLVTDKQEIYFMLEANATVTTDNVFSVSRTECYRLWYWNMHRKL